MEHTKDDNGGFFLDQQMQRELRQVFKKLNKKVILTAILEKNSSKSSEMTQLLNEIAELSDFIEVNCITAGCSPDLEELMDCDGHFPALGIFDGQMQFSGLSYLGIPGGKEINSLVYGLYNVAGPGQTISGKNKKRLTKIISPHRIKVCVSLACHHCCNTVIASQLLSAQNPYLSSQMIDAALFPDIVEKYKLERVPLLILDDTAFLWGEKGIEAILSLLENSIS